jgi:hypothetical protein
MRHECAGPACAKPKRLRFGEGGARGPEEDERADVARSQPSTYDDRPWRKAVMASEAPWIVNWLVGVPLLVLTVLIHVGCLGFFTVRLEGYLAHRKPGRRAFVQTFILVMAIAVLGATALHAFDGAVWAVAYRLVDAIPDARSAMLYSIGAMTTFGHAPIYLDAHWQMLGALEALNGMILFGLTTAFLFAMIQRLWPALGQGPTLHS